jgi:hypothetical protein
MPIVKLDITTKKPVVPATTIEAMTGTEPNHFFNIFYNAEGVVAGFRTIGENYSDTPGEKIRIRVEGVEGDAAAALVLLGFTRKDAGHYSVVEERDTPRIINLVRELLSYLS